MEILINTELFWDRSNQLLLKALQTSTPPPPTLQTFIADNSPRLQQNKALDEKYISGTFVSRGYSCYDKQQGYSPGFSLDAAVMTALVLSLS